jgi:hypothetical protein
VAGMALRCLFCCCNDVGFFIFGGFYFSQIVILVFLGAKSTSILDCVRPSVRRSVRRSVRWSVPHNVMITWKTSYVADAWRGVGGLQGSGKGLGRRRPSWHIYCLI